MTDDTRALLLRTMPAVFVLIWSTGFVAARLGMPYAPPMKFLALRYALSVLCFLPWILACDAVWPQRRRQWLHLAVTGVLMHGIYLGGVWAAVKSGMGAGLAALIVGLQPLLTALWMAQAGSVVRARQWLGLVCGLCGVFLVLFNKLQASAEISALTLGFAVAALLGITAGTLYQKRFVQACDVRTANTIQLLAALVLTAPLAAFESAPIEWSPSLWTALAWSVLALTLGGSSLLYLLIQRGVATAVTSLMYLVPPSTAVLAWLLFDEPITWMTAAGMALAAWGVSWVVRAPLGTAKSD